MLDINQMELVILVLVTQEFGWSMALNSADGDKMVKTKRGGREL
jgi:hypothetical protein